jgi:DNA polymerase delta subunit 2
LPTAISITLCGGQNLNDAFKYVNEEDRMELALNFLQWRHIAPTAPDTLCMVSIYCVSSLCQVRTDAFCFNLFVWPGCYPYLNDDPFVIPRRPSIFAVGNQPEFQTTLHTDADSPDEPPVRVILVPDFSNSGTVVLVNMKTMDVKELKFRSEWN